MGVGVVRSAAECSGTLVAANETAVRAGGLVLDIELHDTLWRPFLDSPTRLAVLRGITSANLEASGARRDALLTSPPPPAMPRALHPPARSAETAVPVVPLLAEQLS